MIGLCTKAWEVCIFSLGFLSRHLTTLVISQTTQYLEKLQKQHEDLQRLVHGLAQIQPFIDLIKNHAKEAALQHVILALLLVIEDTCNFIINSMYQTNTGEQRLASVNDRA